MYKSDCTVLYEFEKQLKPTQNRLRGRFAESASAHPDLSKRFSFIQGGALETLAAAIAIDLYSPIRYGYFRNQAYEKMMQTAKRNGFQGKWKLVGGFLSTKHFSSDTVLQWCLQNFSTKEIFGNLIPLVNRVSRGIYFRVPNTPLRVRRPHRKRGYDDKGSLLLPHEIHSSWEWTGPNPVKEEQPEVVPPRSRQEWYPEEETRGDQFDDIPLPEVHLGRIGE